MDEKYALMNASGKPFTDSEKKSGHFPNLAKILAGVVTQPEQEQNSSGKNADPSVQVMKKLQ